MAAMTFEGSENTYLQELIVCLNEMEADMGHNKQLSYNEILDALVNMFMDLPLQGRKVFFIGNGGSAGISMHMTTDFLKNGRLQTHSMHDPATLTCLANDFGYEQVFSKQLEMAAKPGDVLVAISSSGRSENILRAVRLAKDKKCRTVTLSGFAPDNPLRSMGDYNIYVKSHGYGIVESLHQLFLQHVVDEVMKRYIEQERGQ
ncbi:MAG: SIS domain-containing protein [Selenomonas ruminantium]|nr:SIS domain-containing protein [Selenomonas ruminantium]